MKIKWRDEYMDIIRIKTGLENVTVLNFGLDMVLMMMLVPLVLQNLVC
jgi:hypothetical protein